MPLIEKIVKNKDELKKWRHELHAIPEIAFDEENEASVKVSPEWPGVFPRFHQGKSFRLLLSGRNRHDPYQHR